MIGLKSRVGIFPNFGRQIILTTSTVSQGIDGTTLESMPDPESGLVRYESYPWFLHVDCSVSGLGLLLGSVWWGSHTYRLLMPGGPFLPEQPMDKTLVTGESSFLRVTATGTPRHADYTLEPLAYQWLQEAIPHRRSDLLFPGPNLGDCESRWELAGNGDG